MSCRSTITFRLSEVLFLKRDSVCELIQNSSTSVVEGTRQLRIDFFICTVNTESSHLFKEVHSPCNISNDRSFNIKRTRIPFF
jgi:hypothetical protein